MADGIQKMGAAWQSLAGNQAGPSQPNPQASNKVDEDVDSSDAESDMSCDNGDDIGDLFKDCQKASTSNKEDDNLLDDIEKGLDDDDDIGPETLEKLARIANKSFGKMTDNAKLSKMKDSYPRPKNCDEIVVPKVNKKVWRKMNQGFMKTIYLSLMKIQSNLTKAAFAMIKATEMLVAGNNNTEATVRACTDAICLIGNANTQLSLKRRELLKPVLKKDAAGLCDKNVPITALLFGDDLPKILKETREANKLGNEFQYQSKNGKRGGKHFPHQPQWKRRKQTDLPQKKYRKE
jgi:hypothetical protein